MINLVLASLSFYLTLALAGLGAPRFGLEATAAGIVGALLTSIHVLVSVPECTFDSYNVAVGVGLWLFFLGLYFGHAVISKKGQK